MNDRRRAAAKALTLRCGLARLTGSVVLKCILSNTMSSTVLTLRLDSRLKKKLEKLSRSTNRSKSFLAAEAIREYIDINEWQIAEIKKGLQEADRGDFATEEELQKVIDKWTRNAR